MTQLHWTKKLGGLIRMCRPAFLLGGVAFYALGSALALATGGTIDLGTLIVGQLAISAIQLTTHLSNEYFDLPGDLLNPTPTRWTGGSRVLTAGTLPRWSALAAAGVSAVAALAACAVLWSSFDTGAAAAPLLLVALALGWSYSAPPLRLENNGLGEIDVAVVTSGLTPLVAYVLQTGQLELSAVIAVLPLCVLQVAVSMAANFPDAAGDELSGKRTLVVRLGKRRAGHLYAGLVLASFAVLPLQLVAGLPPTVPLAIAASLPLALWLSVRVGRGAWVADRRWDQLCFWTNALSMATVGLMGAALLAAA